MSSMCVLFYTNRPQAVTVASMISQSGWVWVCLVEASYFPRVGAWLRCDVTPPRTPTACSKTAAQSINDHAARPPPTREFVRDLRNSNELSD